MKTTDLRIGNIINFTENDELAVVEEIDKEGVKVDTGKELVWIELWAFSPIKLTDEWLLKSGFKDSGVLKLIIAYEDSDYPCSLQVSGSGIQICRSGIGAICPDIKYVHQLQNLYFALTGQELKLKDER